MKKQSIIFIICCLFLLILFIFNIWLMNMTRRLSGRMRSDISFKGERAKPPAEEPALRALDIERRVQQPEERIKEHRDMILKKKVETLEIGLEEQEKEAEALGIKPIEKEMQDLQKRKVIIY